MLYLISTPIGNLEDITLRALKILKKCDYILCEDTRRSSRLLHYYDIDSPLISYHKFSEKKLEQKILKDLETQKEIALISDAGTPLINDPGYSIVQKCIEQSIPYTSLPGACSVIQALLLSGFDTESFQFLGFLPKGSAKRKVLLQRALFYLGTTIFFESPNRVLQTLKTIEELDTKREIALIREMTKLHEECLRNIPSKLIDHFTSHPPKGECVLLISKRDMIPEQISENELINLLHQYQGMHIKDAVKCAAKLLKKPKRDRYRKS